MKRHLLFASTLLLSACGGSSDTSEQPTTVVSPPPIQVTPQYSNVCIVMRVDYETIYNHSHDVYGIAYTDGFNAIELRATPQWSQNSAAYYDWLVKTENRRFSIDIFKYGGFAYTAELDVPKAKNIAMVYMVIDVQGNVTKRSKVEYIDKHPFDTSVTPCSSYKVPIN